MRDTNDQMSKGETKPITTIELCVFADMEAAIGEDLCELKSRCRSYLHRSRASGQANRIEIGGLSTADKCSAIPVSQTSQPQCADSKAETDKPA